MNNGNNLLYWLYNCRGWETFISLKAYSLQLIKIYPFKLLLYLLSYLWPSISVLLNLNDIKIFELKYNVFWSLQYLVQSYVHDVLLIKRMSFRIGDLLKIECSCTLYKTFDPYQSFFSKYHSNYFIPCHFDLTNTDDINKCVRISLSIISLIFKYVFSRCKCYYFWIV